MKAVRVAMRALRLPWREQRDALSAAALLGRASLALKLRPFATAIRFGAIPTARARTARNSIVDDSVRAIRRASYAAPWRSVCIHEGLALQRLLRRQGIAAILCYGTSQANGELQSHVWVTVDEEIVIGGEQAPYFELVATFPTLGEPQTR